MHTMIKSLRAQLAQNISFVENKKFSISFHLLLSLPPDIHSSRQNPFNDLHLKTMDKLSSLTLTTDLILTKYRKMRRVIIIFNKIESVLRTALQVTALFDGKWWTFKVEFSRSGSIYLQLLSVATLRKQLNSSVYEMTLSLQPTNHLLLTRHKGKNESPREFLAVL